MYYAEVAFARTRLLWFSSVCLAVAAVFTYFVTFPPPGARIHNLGQAVWFNPVLIGASVAACIMASLLAGTLNRDQPHLAYVWTRPAPRVRIALGYMLVDIVTILLSYAVVVAIFTMVLAVPPRNSLTFDSETGGIFVRSIGVPLMVYAIIEVATSWSPRRFGSVAGVFWPTAWFALILSEIVPFPFGELLRILNLLNPIAYIADSHGQGINATSGFEQPHTIALTFAVKTILAYGIFAVACVVAIYNWKRMEA